MRSHVDEQRAIRIAAAVLEDGLGTEQDMRDVTDCDFSPIGVMRAVQNLQCAKQALDNCPRFAGDVFGTTLANTLETMSRPSDINLDRIDFISAYCDRWCERCAFTSRCSAYAVDVAMAMCDGDFAAALELAVGAPPPMDRAEAARREAFLELFANDQPSEAELDEVRRDAETRDERLDESPITTGAKRFSTLAWGWLRSNRNARALTSNQPLTDAIAVAGWDAHLIGAKLHRALHGRDEYEHGNGCDDDPVQNDWNGSAKVALISIRRSIDAWAAIATATGDADAVAVGEELRRLETEVERTFADAWKFIRPGFDQMP